VDGSYDEAALPVVRGDELAAEVGKRGWTFEATHEFSGERPGRRTLSATVPGAGADRQVLRRAGPAGHRVVHLTGRDGAGADATYTFIWVTDTAGAPTDRAAVPVTSH